MHRFFSVLGGLLVIAGVALLGYVGLVYARQSSVAVPHWNQSEQQKGTQIAQKLAAPQKLAVPTGKRSAPLIGVGTEPALRMIIPRIGVNAPVAQTAAVNGVWDVVDWAVGHLVSSPNPGGIGNGAYSAHDDIKGEVFKRLGELKPGDKILLRTQHTIYTYVVTRQLVVDPSDVSVLNSTTRSTVTLISCTPYWVDTQRLIVQGNLKSSTAA